ncbi:MAG: hypothetical protein ACLUSP_02040 [Christensenellales bacterium]
MTVTKYVERLAFNRRRLGKERFRGFGNLPYFAFGQARRRGRRFEDDSTEPSIKRGFLFNTYTYEIDSPFAGAGSDLTGETTPAAGSLRG